MYRPRPRRLLRAADAPTGHELVPAVPGRCAATDTTAHDRRRSAAPSPAPAPAPSGVDRRVGAVPRPSSGSRAAVGGRSRPAARRRSSPARCGRRRRRPPPALRRARRRDRPPPAPTAAPARHRRPDRRRRRGPRLGRHDHLGGRLVARPRSDIPSTGVGSGVDPDRRRLHPDQQARRDGQPVADGRARRRPSSSPATIVTESDDKDLALIKVDATGLTPGDHRRLRRAPGRPDRHRHRQPARHVHRDGDEGHPVGHRPDDHRPGRGDGPARDADRPAPDRRRDQPRQQRRAAPRRDRAGHRHQHRRLDRRRGPRLRDPDHGRGVAHRPGRRALRRAERASTDAQARRSLPWRSRRSRSILLLSFKTPDDAAARPDDRRASRSSSRATRRRPRPRRQRDRDRPTPRRPPRAPPGAGDRVRRRRPRRPSTARSSTPGSARSRSRSSSPTARSSDVVALQLPTGRRSGQISTYAEPILREEALQAQSAKIDIVSGRDLHQRRLRPVAPGGARPGRASADRAPGAESMRRVETDHGHDRQHRRPPAARPARGARRRLRAAPRRRRAVQHLPRRQRDQPPGPRRDRARGRAASTSATCWPPATTSPSVTGGAFDARRHRPDGRARSVRLRQGLGDRGGRRG